MSTSTSISYLWRIYRRRNAEITGKRNHDSAPVSARCRDRPDLISNIIEKDRRDLSDHARRSRQLPDFARDEPNSLTARPTNPVEVSNRLRVRLQNQDRGMCAFFRKSYKIHMKLSSSRKKGIYGVSEKARGRRRA